MNVPTKEMSSSDVALLRDRISLLPERERTIAKAILGRCEGFPYTDVSVARLSAETAYTKNSVVRALQNLNDNDFYCSETSETSEKRMRNFKWFDATALRQTAYTLAIHLSGEPVPEIYFQDSGFTDNRVYTGRETIETRNSKIGNPVYNYRCFRGVSLRNMAKLLSVKYGAVCRTESSMLERKPNKILVRLSVVSGQPVSFLLQ